MSRSTPILAAAAALAFAASASAQFTISELFTNPPGADDGQEFLEIRGPASTSLAGYWFVVIEGDGASGGVVDIVQDLSTFSTGTNGLLLIRDTATVLSPAPDVATSVSVFNWTPDIENTSNTYILGSGTPPAVTTDLDTGNDGTLDAPLAGFTVSDAFAILESDATPADEYGYADDLGFPNLGPVSTTAGAAGGFYRIYNSDGSSCAWVGGFVLGTTPGPYSFDVAGVNSFGFSAQGITSLNLDPGSLNAIPDSDGDGVANSCDGCPTDGGKTAAGICGCFVPEGCSLGIDIHELSGTTGGAQTLNLMAGAGNAGKTYYVFGSVTGTSPGIPLGGALHLDLNYDFYFEFLLAAPNTIVTNSFSTLDGSGNATAVFNLPPATSIPFAVPVYHAYVVINAFNKPIFASNTVDVILNP